MKIDKSLTCLSTSTAPGDKDTSFPSLFRGTTALIAAEEGLQLEERFFSLPLLAEK